MNGPFEHCSSLYPANYVASLDSPGHTSRNKKQKHGPWPRFSLAPTSDFFGLPPDPSIAKRNPPMGTWLAGRIVGVTPRPRDLGPMSTAVATDPWLCQHVEPRPVKNQASRGLAYPSHLSNCSSWIGRDCPPRAPSRLPSGKKRNGLWPSRPDNL
jgi:hypothetical protein